MLLALSSSRRVHAALTSRRIVRMAKKARESLRIWELVLDNRIRDLFAQNLAVVNAGRKPSTYLREDARRSCRSRRRLHGVGPMPVDLSP